MTKFLTRPPPQRGKRRRDATGSGYPVEQELATIHVIHTPLEGENSSSPLIVQQKSNRHRSKWI